MRFDWISITEDLMQLDVVVCLKEQHIIGLIVADDI